MKRSSLLMALFLLGGLLARADAAPWVAGLHRLTLVDPVDAKPMHALAFYPSSGEARPVRIEGYQTRVAEEAPVAMGQFPLLVISHGNTGSPMALHDLANGLARQGFVVPPGHPQQPLWPAAADQRRDHSGAKRQTARAVPE
ncbi:hypothetical protein WR25_22363 [Diploscapter pachys]|uniref:1-alkyl-2-acetylglycerophosphocholine esterase n=1 Tax=Diploscapter pachys TaxID=2018661 RepID=A0A2A2M4C7_9BILA|nr:hypothetical protein WR25_22363 [Diploscapter pachys]